MIIGTGTDIIEIERVRKLVSQEPFPTRIFAESEQQACLDEELGERRKVYRYAGLFAAKEAVMKALGTGWTGGVSWQEIVISHTAKGKPRVTLIGKTLEIAQQMGVERMHVSISHCESYAIGFVVLEGMPTQTGQ